MAEVHKLLSMWTQITDVENTSKMSDWIKSDI